MSRKKASKKKEEEQAPETTSQEVELRDPTIFLFLWLGVPMIFMFSWAIFYYGGK